MSEKIRVDATAIADRYRELADEVRALGGERVRIVAVTKTFPAEAIAAVVAAGCTRIGENYAQELIDKWVGFTRVNEFGSVPEVHFIGGLQSNKVRSLASIVDVWQSVDRESVMTELSRRRPGARILLQVNATGEVGKGGCQPEHIEGLLSAAASGGLTVEGLMTVGPTDGDPERTRDAFRTVARLAVDLGLPEISMGMSGDWRMAVEEGSTLIRVGSAIFGKRPPRTL
ncbi:MAG: hypothetical protein RL726_162 [Actinomycetota bacterium]